MQRTFVQPFVPRLTAHMLKPVQGHSFIVFLDKGFPVSVLNAIKAVPEVCRM